MRILVIEDNQNKYNDIEETLNKILFHPSIVWKKSKNSGLNTVIENNIRGIDVPYDMVICDNYLPLYDNLGRSMPMAGSIISRIRSIGLKELPIIVCSSDEIENCEYDYKIKYEPNVSLDDKFKKIFKHLKI